VIRRRGTGRYEHVRLFGSYGTPSWRVLEAGRALGRLVRRVLRWMLRW
jgi:hypothetical protein